MATTTIKAKKRAVIPTTLQVEFKRFFQRRLETTNGIESLVVKYLDQTLSGWRKLQEQGSSKIRTHLSSFWPELWVIASESMSSEEFAAEKTGLLRSLEFDVGLYFAKHRCLSGPKLRAIAEQVGRDAASRPKREAAAARIIRKHNLRRTEDRRAEVVGSRNRARASEIEAAHARAESRRIRGHLNKLVGDGKLAAADIDPGVPPVHDDQPTGLVDPILGVFLSTLAKFGLDPDGDRRAFVAVFSSLVDLFDHPDFKDRFGAPQFRDYWIGAARLFKEGVQVHAKQLAAVAAE